MRVFERSAPRVFLGWRRMRWTILTSLAVTGMAVGLAAYGGSSDSGSTSSQAAEQHCERHEGGRSRLGLADRSGSTPSGCRRRRLTQKAHPNVHMKIVTFDGDANGATTLQTKIQL